MKKIICNIMLAVLLMLCALTTVAMAEKLPQSNSTPVTADSSSTPAISLEEAKKLAMKMFAVPQEYKLEHANYEEFPGRKVWNFRWVGKVSFQHTSMHIAIDADTGELRNYYYEHPSIWEAAWQVSSGLSRKEAKEIAINFIEKHNPQRLQYLQEVEVPVYKEHYSGKRPMKRYHFRFVRLVEGIAFDEEGAYIDVMENGKIASYSFNWSKLPSDLPDPKFTIKEAEDIFVKDLGLKLTYLNQSSGQTQPGKATNKNKLVYQIPEYVNFYIDAVTGEIKDFSGINLTPDYLRALNETPQEKTPEKFYINNSKVAKEDAMQAAQEKLAIPDSYQLNSTEYRMDYFSGRPVWVLRYTTKDTSLLVSNIEVNVAADNTEIISFYKFRYYPPGQSDKDAKMLSKEELKKIAEDFITKIVPEKAQSVQLDPQLSIDENNPKLMESRERWLHFTRFVKGIPVAGEGIGVAIDPVSGEIINFNQQFSKVEFKEPSNILSSEKIHEKFFKEPGLKLSYFRIYKSGYDGRINEPTYVLGYRLQPEAPRKFDAVTGQPVYEEWQKPATEINYPKDIEKHSYSQAIIKVIDLNIMGGRTKDAFYPDTDITKAEFVKALVVAKGYAPIYDTSKLPYTDVAAKAWYAPYLKTALAQGIITTSTKFNPQATLTREDASEMIVRALGFERIAKLDIFKNPKQIKVTGKDIGFAAIVEGLKIFPEYKATITRGEAAQVIINTLMLHK